MNELYDEFSFKVNEIRLESKAAANAILALQGRIRELETDKENLENHVAFLLTALPGNEGEKGKEEGVKREEESCGKMFDSLEILLSRAEFLEKELRRKEQQYRIDRENWELERKMMVKNLVKARGSLKPSKGKTEKFPLKNSEYKSDGGKEIKGTKSQQPNEPNKRFKGQYSERQLKESDLGRSSKSPRSSRETELIISKYEEKLSHLTQIISAHEDTISNLNQMLKHSQTKVLETEESLHKSRMNFNNTLEILENEVNMMKKSQHSSDLVQENIDLKRKLSLQTSKIDSLTYELEDWKLNYNKLNELGQFLRKEEPKFDIEQRPIQELEGNIERLSSRYRDLLEKTRRQEENYPELRNELRQTAFDLEYQSFLLYQQRKPQDLTISGL